MSFKRFALPAIAAAIATFGLGAAHAASLDSTFNVTLVVKPKCVFGTTAPVDIDLGEADANTSGLTTNVGKTTFTVQCTKKTSYTISLNPTNAVAGADNASKLNGFDDNTQQVDYALYSDEGYSVPWGKTSIKSATATSSAQQPYTVYAKVSAVGDVAQGKYSDKVTITLTY